MKKPKFIIGLLFLAATSFIVLLFEHLHLSAQSNINSKKLDEFIQVDKLSGRAIILRIGYDAVTAIASKEGIVVIDAGISNSLTIHYRKAIEKIFDRKDFTHLINTHSHPDHIGGNQVFSDCVIVGHENCLNEISEYWKDREKVKASLYKVVNQYEDKLKSFNPEWEDSLEIYLQKIRYQHAYDDLLNNRVVTLPKKTFADTMSISMENITLNLIYFGHAHSGSDIVIHIPEEKILMVGDLFSEYGRPSIAEINKVDSDRWMIVKQWISERLDKIEMVIGGHGQIMERKDLQSFINNFEERSAEQK